MSHFDLFSFDLLQEFFLFLRPLEKIFTLDELLRFRGQRNQIVLIDDKFRNRYSLIHYQISYDKKVLINKLIRDGCKIIAYDYFLRFDINDNSSPNKDKLEKEKEIAFQIMVENFHNFLFYSGDVKERIAQIISGIILYIDKLNELSFNPRIIFLRVFRLHLQNKIMTRDPNKIEEEHWAFSRDDSVNILFAIFCEAIFHYGYDISFILNNKKEKIVEKYSRVKIYLD